MDAERPDVPAGLDSREERVLVAELSRGVLWQVAPEELDVFDAAPEQFLDGRAGTGKESSDEMLGFGLGAVALLAPYVVAAVQIAIRFAVEELALAGREQARPHLMAWVRRAFRLGDTDGPMPAAIPVDLAARVRELTFASCQSQGLPESDAALVADAVAGRLLLGP